MDFRLFVNWIIYLIWVFIIIFWFIYSLLKYKKFSFLLLTLIMPLISLIIFTYVFAINNGSSTVQLSESFELWSLWFRFYLFLVFGNLISFSVVFISLFFPPYLTENWKKFVLKLFILLTIIITLYHLFLTMPDA